MSDYILEMNHITKEFSGVKALDDVNLKVKKGEVHALCGENGAGKSTLMNVLSGVYPYGTYSGDIVYKGEVGKFHKIKDSEAKGIVIIHQELALSPYMSVAENVFLGNEQCSGKGVIDWTKTRAKATEMLAKVGLEDEDVNVPVNSLGVGKQQLIEIAKAMAKDVELLILDEPTAGLDPKERVRFRNLISSFSRNKIVLLSTHIVPDVEYIADEILVMKDGKFLHRGAPEVITREAPGLVWECRVDSKDAVRYVEKYNVGNLKNAGKETVLRIISDTRPMEGAAEAEPTLEDLYLYYFSEEGTEQ